MLGVQARIVGEMHGQQTINVLNFKSAESPADDAAKIVILLRIAVAIVECVESALLPAVTSDWEFIRVDTKSIAPAVSDDVTATPVTLPSVGALSATSVSFAASLAQIKTGGGGRSGRGRIFLPPPGETEVTGSVMTGPTLALVVAFFTCMAGKFLGASSTDAAKVGVLSRKLLAGVPGNFDAAFRPAVEFVAQENMSCLRSRKKEGGQ